MEIFEMSGLELAEAVRNKEVSAVEVLDSVYSRIEQFPQVGAFAHVTPELAGQQAEETDRRVVRGETLPFDGVPVPIKALTPVQGQPQDSGSRLLLGNVAEEDGGVVTLLKEAGTLMVGKTSAPEFGFPAYTEPETGPSARTPWDVRRTAGGSSGGAAAAVATGMVPVAHASDGGGSIRIPSACCGTVGLKPSRGVVSPGPVGVSGGGLTTDGVITRTVADSAAFLDVLAKPWPGESYNAPRDPLLDSAGSYLEASKRAPGPLRIGLLLEPLNVESLDLHPEAEAAAKRMAAVLEGMGHVVEEAGRPFTADDWLAFMPLWTGSAAGIPLAEDDLPKVTELTRWLREEGMKLSAADYSAAVNAVQTLTRKAANGWSQFDLILTPTLASPPVFPEDIVLPHGADDFEAQKRFTPWGSVWNMTGNASITLPVHRADVDGVALPFGAMLSAVRPGGDGRLLALAAQVEQVDPWPTITAPTV